MPITDPNVINQFLQGLVTGGGVMRTPAEQFSGIFDAKILDTDHTNANLPAGNCRVTVPAYNSTIAFGPILYPGNVAPPDGTLCEVGFITPVPGSTSATSVRVLSLYGVGSAGDGLSPFLLMGA